MLLTGVADDPARIEPIVSRKKSSQRLTTSAGISSYFSPAAKPASVALGCSIAVVDSLDMEVSSEGPWKAQNVFRNVRQNQVGRNRCNLIQTGFAEFTFNIVFICKTKSTVELQ